MSQDLNESPADEFDSEQLSTPEQQPKRQSAHHEWAGGFVQGIGVGLLLAGVTAVLPRFAVHSGALGVALLIAGAVMLRRNRT